MKQLGLLLGGAIKNFEQARRTKQQADAETLERLAKRAGMTPQDAARLAMNLAPLPAGNGAVYHATACTERRCRPLDREALQAPDERHPALGRTFTAAHPSTGEILLTRAELAARLGWNLVQFPS